MDAKVVHIKSTEVNRTDSNISENILPPLLSVREVCKYLGLGETKVREIIKKGELPHTRVRSRIRVFATDLREYLEQNRG